MSSTAQVQEVLAAADLARTRQWHVAEQLGISLTTLRRRLQEEGSSYSDLLDAERKARVNRTLSRNPHADGGRLKLICGYTEQNSLYRALRRWFGCGIQELRKG